MLTLRSFMMIAAVAVAVASQPFVVLAQERSELKFELYKDAKAQFRWRLKAANGQMLATGGQGYRSKADCERGIKIVQRAGEPNAKTAFEVYEDSRKGFRWRLKASNGNVVAGSSESYKRRADCESAIDLIKKAAGRATVAEVKP